jgi:hypothetical protein
MPTIRQLTAAFGFEVDTTPAERFNTAFNKTRANVEKGFNVQKLGRGLKKAFQVGAGGLAAGIGTSIVASLKFGNIKQALSQLEFQFKGSFQPLREEVKAILADPVLGKLTTELELLNTAATQAGEGIDRGFIIRNLRNILSFSTQFRQNIGEGTATFIEFIKSGNLEALLKTGQITAEQAQFLQAAGIGPGKEGIQARQLRLEELFRELSPQIRLSIEKLIEEGALSQKRFSNTLDKLTAELGEKTLPAFSKITEGAIDLLDEFSGRTKKEGIIESFFKTFLVVPKGAGEGSAPLLSGLGDSDFIPKVKADPEGINKFVRAFLDFAAPSTQRASEALAGINEVNNTVNITVESGAVVDESKLSKAIGDEMSKVFGRSVQGSQNTTLTRGSGQVR